MNRNVTASFSLSVLTVMAFAVILYQPEGPNHPESAPSKGANGESPKEILEARPISPEPPLVVEPLAKVVDAIEPIEATPKVPEPPLEVEPLAPVVEAIVPSVDPPTPPSPELGQPPDPGHSLPLSPVPSRGAFTQARGGETLFDLARRVYGTADEAEELWRANRDTLDRIDSPIPEGAMLRTP